LRKAGLQLEQLRSAPAGLQLQVTLDGEQRGSFHLHGPLAVQIGRLQQAQLHPQGWRWQGRLDANPQTTRLDGQLGNDAGLALDLQVQRPSSGAVNLQGTLAEIVLASGNPLAKTLRDWPQLLELSSGRLAASTSLRLAAGSLTPSADLSLQLQQVGGIYDRSELSGLDARLEAELRGEKLFIELPDLRLASLNPGVPLGPLQLRADYQAALAQPLAGRLQLWQADSGLLGGQLHVAPTRLELARRPLQLPVQVRGVELAKLLEVYPAEGLSGTGTLDGLLPLRIDRNGLSIDNGQVQARAPGGVLQFHSERIRAFGQSNPALQLATLALEDFHYDQLNGQVSYDPQGKLLLVLRLHGRNPALEGGRPVNFTINLEEDVPSLLTSLQLGGRVNEAIQRRVQQRLQPRN
ncbi:MAG TPA: YdbH domain-containing protein, partial [Pseudomonas sp.]